MNDLMIALEAVADQLESKAKKRVHGIALGEFDPKAVVVEGVDGEELDPWDLFDDWVELVWSGEVETEDLVSCSKEPRGGMLTYNYTLAAAPLASGRRLYLEWGDMTEFQAVGVAAADAPTAVDLHFIQLHGPGQVDVPFSVAGDLLFKIDVIWSEAAVGGFILDALTDDDADWMDDRVLDLGSARWTALEESLEEAREEGELSDEQLSVEMARLQGTPPWFLTLSDAQLDKVAALPLPAADWEPPLKHTFAPWQRPTGEIFLRPTDSVSLQHIVAAWVVGGFS